jgi:hypothetical protein
MKLKPPFASTIAALALTLAAHAQTPVIDAFKTLSDDERTYFQHVTTLSSPFFEGRAPGSRGNQLAAEYVEFNFRKAGLTPAFPVKADGSGGRNDASAIERFASFRQAFSTGKETVAKTQALSYQVGGKTIILAPGADFAVRGTSGTGAVVSLPVVFVGYGISDGKDGYSSFTGMKDDEGLDGKVALLLRFEPLNDKGKSRWSDDGSFSGKSTLAGKLRSLANHKAAAVLLVSPPGVDDARANTIEDTKSSTQGTALSMPVINLHVDAATKMLAAAGGDLLALRKAADEKGGATDVAGLTVSVDAAVTREANSTDNVGGVLVGRGSLKDDYLVIGAHYDHVGYGLFGSRTNAVGKLHPGADDNASGTAGLLMLASKLAADYAALPKDADARSIIFVAFSGEEGGLIGSRHFVKNAPVEASHVYAMLNMDMIGRARHDSQGRPKCEVSGVGSAKGFDELLKPMFDASGVAIKTLPGGQGPSDHASFYRGNIPVLHFFTGLHDQYHAPTDTYNYIDATGAMKVCELVRTVANALDQRTEVLEFTQAKGSSIDMNEPTEDARAITGDKPADKPADKAVAAKPEEPTPSKRARTPEVAPPAGDPNAAPDVPVTRRVRFGIAPGNYSDTTGGVEVQDVYPNTPATLAGVQKGDYIIEWNGQKVDSTEQWNDTLKRAKPGDEVSFKVKRGTETLTLKCTLVARDE